MTLNRILLELLNVNGAVVDGAEFGDDASWSEVGAGGEGDYRFFRVTVEMP